VAIRASDKVFETVEIDKKLNFKKLRFGGAFFIWGEIV